VDCSSNSEESDFRGRVTLARCPQRHRAFSRAVVLKNVLIVDNDCAGRRVALDDSIQRVNEARDELGPRKQRLKERERERGGRFMHACCCGVVVLITFV